MIQDKVKIFCKCESEKHNNESLQCSDAEMIIVGLNDAREEMNYSNWHADKFDRAIEVIKAYCAEHEIPMRFVPSE